MVLCVIMTEPIMGCLTASNVMDKVDTFGLIEGSCVNGKCICNSTFIGTDCAD